MVSSLSLALTETSSHNTYISGDSMQQTSIHHTQPLNLQKDVPGSLNALEKGCRGQITDLPAPPKLKAHKNQLANSIMDKNGGMMIGERIPLLTQIGLRLPELAPALFVALNSHVPTLPKTKCFSTTQFLTRPQPSAIHEP